MSDKDVTNGALATAGSRPKRVKNNGSTVPIVLPITTTITIVNATTTPTPVPPRATAITEMQAAIVNPSEVATTSSRNSRRNPSESLASPIARARTTKVAACAPALPLLPINNGRKITKATLAEIVDSKLAMAAPENRLANTNANNHPTRLL
jgi:hypothetical protein